MPPSSNSRILIEYRFWTPFRNEVFTDILGSLENNNAALVYLSLYDRAWHSNARQVSATVAQLSKSMGLDARTLTKCLRELETRNLIDRVDSGILRSQTKKPCWQVPMAQFRLQNQKWTPIPRFLITDYFPTFPNAVLLVVLLYYQHMSWNNFCWAGVKTLSERIGWSRSRVRRALRLMNNRNRWERQTSGDLPVPLKITTVNERRRYRVLAVFYTEIEKKFRGKQFPKVVIVAPSFRRRFGLGDPYYYG